MPAMQKIKNIVAALPEPETIDVEALQQDISRGVIDMICVLGPTASGKTRYAVELAHRLAPAASCEIISADSRQVYKGMDIGTGKDLEEYGSLPYHLIDIAEPGTQYNVYRFQQDFRAAYHDIRSRGAFPILCGGTGLYISAVTSEYNFKERKPLSQEGAEADIRTFFIGTLVSREVRNSRIDARLDARLQQGMIQEIKGLLDRGIPADTLISYGLEYKFVTLYLLGQIDYDAMREHLAIAIHQFAKRQMTWFRGMERSGICIHWTNVNQ